VRQKFPRRLRKQTAAGDLRALVDETIALHHRLLWVADQLHGADGLSTAQRGILRGLVRYGPQTVPELARARSVRRQTIQPVVDELEAAGLVELSKNPQHARSRLVRIRPRGVAIVERMDTVDRRVLAGVGVGLERRHIEIAVSTLRTVRERFETKLRWAQSPGGTTTTHAASVATTEKACSGG
jgi:DNA-binding MarR family transcriptional regulator